MQHENKHEHSSNSSQEYTKFAIVIAFIVLLSFLGFYNTEEQSLRIWMSGFMGYFLLLFSFFKFLAIRDFVSAYRSYDIIARRSKLYAYLYPFIELALGIAFLIELYPIAVSVFTIVIMSISLIGVIRSLGRGIKCACLGTVIDLPLSNITLVEDLAMLVMAIIMLIL
ncbi:hypothetical protein GF389_00910 [Candidatus Dojkabacteria bacterium]|nr:hypothetical protein [Candidatus Dojkabacteria bacterium]